MAAVIILNAVGNLSLAWGMKHFARTLAWNPFNYVRAMLNPYVAFGIGLLICGCDAHGASQLGGLELYHSDDWRRLYTCGRPGRVVSERVGEYGPLVGRVSYFRRHVAGRSHRTEDGVARMNWLLLAVIVVATVLGDLLQSYEMKRSGEQSVGRARPRPFASRDRQPQVSAARNRLHGGFVFRVHGACPDRAT